MGPTLFHFTLRLPPLLTPPAPATELKDQTIHIRIAGVDAPEAAHFGRPAQPHSAESLAWLRAELLGNPEGAMPPGGGRRVWVRLLRRDQYGRIVRGVPGRGTAT